jgi:hypothetical protein
VEVVEGLLLLLEILVQVELEVEVREVTMLLQHQELQTRVVVVGAQEIRVIVAQVVLE